MSQAISWIVLSLVSPHARAEEPTPAPEAPAAAPEPAPKPSEPKWYEVLKVRGYTQFRYDDLPTFVENDALVNGQGDRYIGEGVGIGIRRARLVLSGDVHPRVGIYLQVDFAGVIADNYHVPQMRDWYSDIYLTGNKALRLRVGQSKIPYGFENLQSSQNRLALDRADPINSALKDERDLGVIAYWAPPEVRKRFKELVEDGLKGLGDYGVLALGAYNGQTANKFDDNGNFHVVARLTYPVVLGSQIVELGAAAYTGMYRVSTEAEEDGTTWLIDDEEGDVLDQRVGAHLVWYPKPFGLQAEYNLGNGPAQTGETPARIGSEPLSGGYVQTMVKIDDVAGTVALIPFVRGQIYDGGRKHETNAPVYAIRELEFGAEWQIVKPIELTLSYALSERTSPDYPHPQEEGHLFRGQLQINYLGQVASSRRSADRRLRRSELGGELGDREPDEPDEGDRDQPVGAGDQLGQDHREQIEGRVQTDRAEQPPGSPARHRPPHHQRQPDCPITIDTRETPDQRELRDPRAGGELRGKVLRREEDDQHEADGELQPEDERLRPSVARPASSASRRPSGSHGQGSAGTRSTGTFSSTRAAVSDSAVPQSVGSGRGRRGRTPPPRRAARRRSPAARRAR